MNAATIPRAPVIAFQPAIAAARDESEVWSLTTAAIPTSIDALPAPAADGRDPQHRDVRREGVRDQRAEPEHAAEAHRDERPAPVGDGAPDEERQRSSRRPSGSR